MLRSGIINFRTVILLLLSMLFIIFYGIMLIGTVESGQLCHLDKKDDHNVGGKWRDHLFVFVGGVEHSGTVMLERLLASQTLSAGLVVNTKDVADRSGCNMPSAVSPCRCHAPGSQGSFVTSVFRNYHLDRGSECETICGSECEKSPDKKQWGTRCAMKQHLLDSDAAYIRSQPPGSPFFEFHEQSDQLTPTTNVNDEFVDKLFSDWGMFWTDLNAPYLIEHDIANTVQSTFLQTLFGPTRTAFVFVLKVITISPLQNT